MITVNPPAYPYLGSMAVLGTLSTTGVLKGISHAVQYVKKSSSKDPKVKKEAQSHLIASCSWVGVSYLSALGFYLSSKQFTKNSSSLNPPTFVKPCLEGLDSFNLQLHDATTLTEQLGSYCLSSSVDSFLDHFQFDALPPRSVEEAICSSKFAYDEASTQLQAMRQTCSGLMDPEVSQLDSYGLGEGLEVNLNQACNQIWFNKFSQALSPKLCSTANQAQNVQSQFQSAQSALEQELSQLDHPEGLFSKCNTELGINITQITCDHITPSAPNGPNVLERLSHWASSWTPSWGTSAVEVYTHPQSSVDEAESA